MFFSYFFFLCLHKSTIKIYKKTKKKIITGYGPPPRKRIFRFYSDVDRSTGTNIFGGKKKKIWSYFFLFFFSRCRPRPPVVKENVPNRRFSNLIFFFSGLDEISSPSPFHWAVRNICLKKQTFYNKHTIVIFFFLIFVKISPYAIALK